MDTTKTRGIKQSITYAMKETGSTYADLRRESGVNIFQHNNINSGMGFQTLMVSRFEATKAVVLLQPEPAIQW